MKNYFAFLLSFFFSLAAFSQVPKLRSADALSTSTNLKSQKFAGTLKLGYHFNDKAPNSLVIDGKDQKLVTLSKQSIEFKMPASWSEGRASLYVCDDAVTYCETHSVEIKGSKNTSTQPSASKEKSVANSARSPKPGKFGFIENDYQKALQIAAAQKKPVLIDFSARWCPGCVRYEKEVFPQSQFSKITSNFVKLKIDVDLFNNSFLSEKYSVRGIPTFVVINANEQEIARLVDFHPVDGVQNFLKTIEKNPVSMQELLSAKDPSSDQSLLVGQRLLASGKVAESIPHFEKVQPPPPELLQARVDLTKAAMKDPTASNKAAYIKELKEALTKENQTTRSLAWRSELVSQLGPQSEETKILLSEGTAVADKALQDPTYLQAALKTESLGEFVGYEKLWVAILKADLIESAGQPTETVVKTWEEAASIGKQYQVSAKKAGPALRYLIVLSAAKKYAEAEKFANEILKVDPKNTDVERRKLKVLLGLNKNAEAVKLGEKILPKAEGRNEFWVAESLAKAYAADNKKTDAKRVLTAYLARPELETEMMKSTKKSMEDLLKTLN